MSTESPLIRSLRTAVACDFSRYMTLAPWPELVE